MIPLWSQWSQGGMNMIQEYKIHNVQQHKGLITFKWLLVAIGCYLVLMVLPEQLQIVEQEDNHFRVRVIANSNTEVDQAHKKKIAADVATAMKTLNVNETADKVRLAKLIKSKYPQTEMRIEYGEQLFPAKFKYGMFTPQNHYNSLVISIGSARGNNWWCSVFKKVCEKDADEKEKKPVKFWLWEWLKDKFR